MQKLIFIILMLFMYNSSFAESLFITDGSILEGEIIREDKISVTLKTETGITSTIPRLKVIRVLYNEEYKEKRFIVKMDETIIEAYIVEETRDTYIYRKNLYSPEEVVLKKNEIDYIARKDPRETVENLVEDTEITGKKHSEEANKTPDVKEKKTDIMLALGFFNMVQSMKYDPGTKLYYPVDDEYETIGGNALTLHLYWFTPYAFTSFPGWFNYSLMCSFNYRIGSKITEDTYYSADALEDHNYSLKTYLFGGSFGLNFNFIYKEFLYLTAGTGINYWNIFAQFNEITDNSNSSGHIVVLNYYLYLAPGIRFHITGSLSLGLEAFFFATPPGISITETEGAFMSLGAVLTAGYAF